MAIVEMKCPNCGGAMQLKDGQFCCPSCRTILLHIIDAKIDTDVSVISPEEFQRKLEESKKSYVVKLENNIKVFDVDTEIINARIKNATEALENREFDKIFDLLSGVSNTILSAERLRMLAKCKVKSEADFVYGADINPGKEHFDNIINLCDELTRRTYLKILNICKERYTRERETETKIGKAAELITVGQLESAFTYSRQICKEDPTNPFVWAWMARLVWNRDNITPKNEFIKMYQTLSFMDETRYHEYLWRIVFFIISSDSRYKFQFSRYREEIHSVFGDKHRECSFEWLKYREKQIIDEIAWVEQVYKLPSNDFSQCWISFCEFINQDDSKIKEIHKKTRRFFGRKPIEKLEQKNSVVCNETLKNYIKQQNIRVLKPDRMYLSHDSYYEYYSAFTVYENNNCNCVLIYVTFDDMSHINDMLIVDEDNCVKYFNNDKEIRDISFRSNSLLYVALPVKLAIDATKDFAASGNTLINRSLCSEYRHVGKFGVVYNIVTGIIDIIL